MVYRINWDLYYSYISNIKDKNVDNIIKNIISGNVGEIESISEMINEKKEDIKEIEKEINCDEELKNYCKILSNKYKKYSKKNSFLKEIKNILCSPIEEEIKKLELQLEIQLKEKQGLNEETSKLLDPKIVKEYRKKYNNSEYKIDELVSKFKKDRRNDKFYDELFKENAMEETRKKFNDYSEKLKKDKERQYVLFEEELKENFGEILNFEERNNYEYESCKKWITDGFLINECELSFKNGISIDYELHPKKGVQNISAKWGI